MKIPLLDTVFGFLGIYWELLDLLYLYASEGVWLGVGILLLMIIAIYGLTLFIIKYAFLDNIFPFLYIRDSLNNRIRVARVISGSKDGKTRRLKNSSYLHIKTSFLPFFDTLPIRIGVHKQRYRWWRSYNLGNDNLKQIRWLDNDNCFEITTSNIGMSPEKLDMYLTDAKSDLQSIANGVTMGVKGDQYLQKAKYQLAVPYPLRDNNNDGGKPIIKISISEYNNLKPETREFMEKNNNVIINPDS